MTREEAKKYLEEVLDGGYVSRLREAAANGGDEFASNMAETVQRALNTLGIRDNAGNVLTVNGVYDTPTIQAMGKFIRQTGYSASGRANANGNAGWQQASSTGPWGAGRGTAEIEVLKDLVNEMIKYFRRRGYSISAEMLEHSLESNPSDYRAGNNSALANAMRNDVDLKERLTEIVNGQGDKTSFSGVKIATFGDHDGFEFEDNDDLKYSIHGISGNTSTVSGQKQTNGSWQLSVHIEDVYDYEFTNFDWSTIDSSNIFTLLYSLWNSSLFATAGANAATWAQMYGIIHPYNVYVDFTMSL